MFEKLIRFLFFAFLMISQAHNFPLHEVEIPGFGRGLVPRLEAFGARQMEAFDGRQVEPRLPLPSPQEVEAIKRVAQLLATLGEQVLPAIIGNFPDHRPTSNSLPSHITEVPNDPVQDN